MLYLGVQRRRLIFGAPIGLIAALIYFEGGIYQTTYLPLVLTALALVIAIQNRSLLPIGLLAVGGVFTLAFAAPKLLPMIQLMGPYGRYVDAFEKNTLSMFAQDLFSRDQFFSRDSVGWVLGILGDGGVHRVFCCEPGVVGCRFSLLARAALVDSVADTVGARFRKSRGLFPLGVGFIDFLLIRRSTLRPVS